jgi:hypothetical protein
MAGYTNAIGNQTINANFSVGNLNADISSPELLLQKSRLLTVINTGDSIGLIAFQGFDGTNNISGAEIRSISSGTIGVNRIPADLEFYTKPDSATAITQRMIINSAGNITINQPDSLATVTIYSPNTIVNDPNSTLVLHRDSNDISPARVRFEKSHNGAVVQTGDNLGAIWITGYDGATYAQSSKIRGIVDAGAIGADSVPGKLEFMTKPVGGVGEPIIRMTMDSTGAVDIIGVDATSSTSIATLTTRRSIDGAIINVLQTGNNTTASQIQMLKNRNGAVIITGDYLGQIVYSGFDGSGYFPAAQILSRSSGTIAAGKIPGNLEFHTKPDSATALTQRMVIDSTGAVTINNPDSGVGLTVSGGGATIVGVYGSIPAGTVQLVTINSSGVLGSSTGGGGVVAWTDVTGATVALDVNNGYSMNRATLITATLPAIAAFGSVIEIVGNGAGGWLLAQNAGQTVHFGNQNTTTGAGGSLASTNRYDSLSLVCTVANTDFVVRTSIGNLTVV